jgi:hypothetical protein
MLYLIEDITTEVQVLSCVRLYGGVLGGSPTTTEGAVRNHVRLSVDESMHSSRNVFAVDGVIEIGRACLWQQQPQMRIGHNEDSGEQHHDLVL